MKTKEKHTKCAEIVNRDEAIFELKWKIFRSSSLRISIGWPMFTQIVREFICKGYHRLTIYNETMPDAFILSDVSHTTHRCVQPNTHTSATCCFKCPLLLLLRTSKHDDITQRFNRETMLRSD